MNSYYLLVLEKNSMLGIIATSPPLEFFSGFLKIGRTVYNERFIFTTVIGCYFRFIEFND